MASSQDASPQYAKEYADSFKEMMKDCLGDLVNDAVNSALQTILPKLTQQVYADVHSGIAENMRYMVIETASQTAIEVVKNYLSDSLEQCGSLVVTKAYSNVLPVFHPQMLPVVTSVSTTVLDMYPNAKSEGILQSSQETHAHLRDLSLNQVKAPSELVTCGWGKNMSNLHDHMYAAYETWLSCPLLHSSSPQLLDHFVGILDRETVSGIGERQLHDIVVLQAMLILGNMDDSHLREHLRCVASRLDASNFLLKLPKVLVAAGKIKNLYFYGGDKLGKMWTPESGFTRKAKKQRRAFFHQRVPECTHSDSCEPLRFLFAKRG